MMFETIRWGVPNLAPIVALACLPLISMAMPGQRPVPPTPFVSIEAPGDDPADIQVSLVQTQQDASCGAATGSDTIAL